MVATTNQVGSNTIEQPLQNQSVVVVVRTSKVVITDQVATVVRAVVDISETIPNNEAVCVVHRGPHGRSTDRNTERRSEIERSFINYRLTRFN